MRVYVLSAFPTVRAGLAALIRAQPGWTLTGEAAPQARSSAVSESQSSLPAAGLDVLLADLDGIADAETLDAWLAALRPRAGLVLLAVGPSSPARGRDEDASSQQLAELARLAEERGLAFGALRRDATEEEILAAITAAGAGLIILDRRVAAGLLAPTERQPTRAAAEDEGPGEPLTTRELEVLQLLAQGLPNKIIAARLRISEHTAKFHVSAILMKLGAASRTEAVTSAARRGLLIL
jgi:DNA-binding NarL/FixJ family response regulator